MRHGHRRFLTLTTALLGLLALVAACGGSRAEDAITDAGVADAAEAAGRSSDPGGAADEGVTDPGDQGDADTTTGEPNDAQADSQPAADTADAGASAQRPGLGTSVLLGRGDWLGSWFQGAVIERLLLELGYDVVATDEVRYDPTSAFSAVAEGTLDVWPNALFPVHEQLLADQFADGETVGERVRVLGTLVPGGAMEGILVTADWARTNRVAWLDDIAADPALAAQLDVTGDGVADIHGCTAGLTCQALIDRLVASNEWTMTQLITSPNGLLDDARTRIEAGEPTLIYGWTPSERIATLTPGSEVIWLGVRNPNPEWATDASLPADVCPARPCNTGFFASDVRTITNADFAARNPVVAALLEAVSIPAGDVSIRSTEIDLLPGLAENPGADDLSELQTLVDIQASEWIIENRVLVESWLATAVAAQ